MKQDGYHHGDLKRSLTQAALKILEAEGEEALSLRKLGKEVGVSQTAIYSHLENKMALFRDLARHGYLNLSERMESARAAQQDAKATLFSLAESYLSFAQCHPNLFKLMFSPMFSVLHKEDDELYLISKNSFEQLQAAIDDYASEEGLAIPRQMAALTTWSAIHGLSHIAIGDRLGQESKEALENGDLLESMFEALIFGIKPRR